MQVAVGAGVADLELHVDTRKLARWCGGVVGEFTKAAATQSGQTYASTHGACNEKDAAAAGRSTTDAAAHDGMTVAPAQGAKQVHGHAGPQHQSSRRLSGAAAAGGCEALSASDGWMEAIAVGRVVRLTSSADGGGVLGRYEQLIEGVVVKGARGCWRVMRLEDYVTGTGKSWRYDDSHMQVGECCRIYIYSCTCCRLSSANIQLLHSVRKQTRKQSFDVHSSKLCKGICLPALICICEGRMLNENC